MKQSELVEFVNLTESAQYDYLRKKRFRFLGRKILKEIVKTLGLKDNFKIRWNPGGEACSGDHILHTDRFYLDLSDNTRSGWFFYRTCKGMKDSIGGRNIIYPWTRLTAHGLSRLVDELKAIQFPS